MPVCCSNQCNCYVSFPEKVFFVESMCNDPDIIAENIQVMMINDKGAWCFIPCMTQINTQYCDCMHNYLIIDLLPFCCRQSHGCEVDFCSQQVKLGSPDYADRDTEEAMQDFIQRIGCYEATYVPIDDKTDRYCHVTITTKWSIW